jgi:hypothetical protein
LTYAFIGAVVLLAHKKGRTAGGSRSCSPLYPKRSRNTSALGLIELAVIAAGGSDCQPQRITNITEAKKTMATSKRESSQAGKDLRNPTTPKRDRGPIASALAQTPRKKK